MFEPFAHGAAVQLNPSGQLVWNYDRAEREGARLAPGPRRRGKNRETRCQERLQSDVGQEGDLIFRRESAPEARRVTSVGTDCDLENPLFRHQSRPFP